MEGNQRRTAWLAGADDAGDGMSQTRMREGVVAGDDAELGLAAYPQTGQLLDSLMR